MNQIGTPRLTMTLAELKDLPALEEIEKECGKYFAFDPPYAGDHNRAIGDCLTAGDFIPNIKDEDYKRENYYLHCIWQDDALIGWLSYYLEYLQRDGVYLSMLYIKESYRAKGIGAEILAALALHFAAAGFRRIRLHCSLRNATALRFWVKNGFDRIMDVECNGNLFPENFGGIELMKTIAR